MELTPHALARAMALTILAATVSVAPPALAQTYDPSYPVCLHVYAEHGDYYECGYTSLPQCAASASGRAAQSLVNPYYHYPAKSYAEPGSHQKRSRQY